MAINTQKAKEMIAKVEDLDVVLLCGNLDLDGSLAEKIKEKFPKVDVINIPHISTLGGIYEITEAVTKA